MTSRQKLELHKARDNINELLALHDATARGLTAAQTGEGSRSSIRTSPQERHVTARKTPAAHDGTRYGRAVRQTLQATTDALAAAKRLNATP